MAINQRRYTGSSGAGGVFRKNGIFVPIYRMRRVVDEGTTSEGEGPSASNVGQGLHRIMDGFAPHPVAKLGGWLQ